MIILSSLLRNYTPHRATRLHPQSWGDSKQKRLTLSGIDCPPSEYLPPDPEQESLLREMKAVTSAEWERVGKPGRQTDYVHRYAIPRLFKELRRSKKRRNYAGFENIVHLSSGIVRYFLEPCYLMFEEMSLQNRETEAKRGIPPSLQADILFKFSEELILDLEKIRKDLPPENITLLDRLGVLLNSLGALFYENLTNPESRDARLFSFTVRGDPSHEARQVLELGVRYRYFQLRTYSTKEGGGSGNGGMFWLGSSARCLSGPYGLWRPFVDSKCSS